MTLLVPAWAGADDHRPALADLTSTVHDPARWSKLHAMGCAICSTHHALLAIERMAGLQHRVSGR